MDIPNLATESELKLQPRPNFLSYPILAICLFLALAAGFWISRLAPSKANSRSTQTTNSGGGNSQVIAPDAIKTSADIKVGQSYGEINKIFKDSATGILEKGSINGEGTHILNRPGGLDQRATLISSVLDLDLFIGHTVEVRGETNASKKSGWLLDVGSIKVTQ